MIVTSPNQFASIVRRSANSTIAAAQVLKASGRTRALLALAFLLSSQMPTTSLHATPLVVNAVFEDNGLGYAHPTTGHFTGVGAAPDTGTLWNSVAVGSGGGATHVSAGPTSALSTSTGGASLITVSLSNYSANDISGTYNYQTTFDPDLFGHIIYGGDVTHQAALTINNVPSGQYDLYLYSMAGYPNSDNTLFVVNGGGMTHATGLPNGATTDPSLVSSLSTGFNSFVDATVTSVGNYVEYTNLAGGTITVDFYGGNGRFNGFQLVQVVPEPASLAMFGLSAVGLLAMFRGRLSKQLAALAKCPTATSGRGRRMSSLTILLVIGLSLVWAGPAAATPLTVNVDFENTSGHTYLGTAVAPDTGTFWNGYANSRNTGPGSVLPVMSGALTASDGSTLTGEHFTLSNFQVGAFAATPIAGDLYYDYVYDTTNSNASTGTFAITGLTSGTAYDFYVYSMTNYNGATANTVFTIDGLAGSSTTVTGLPSADHIDSSFVQVPVGNPGGQTIGNYVLYSAVVAVGGEISGTFAGTNERFNGFQITEHVPEPSSIVLIGLSAAGLMLAARRRRA